MTIFKRRPICAFVCVCVCASVNCRLFIGIIRFIRPQLRFVSQSKCSPTWYKSTNHSWSLWLLLEQGKHTVDGETTWYVIETKQKKLWIFRFAARCCAQHLIWIELVSVCKFFPVFVFTFVADLNRRRTHIVHTNTSTRLKSRLQHSNWSSPYTRTGTGTQASRDERRPIKRLCVQRRRFN